MDLAKGNETTTGTTVFFADDSAELDQAAKEKLAKLLPVLTGKPQKIEIRGHSSRRPLPAASPYKNFWELSYARCLATMQHLQEQGIAPERIRLSQAGVYEPEPSLPGHEPAQQSRVDVHLLDEVAQHFTAPKTAGAKPAAPAHDDHHAPAAAPAHDKPADDHHAPAAKPEHHAFAPALND